MQPTTRVVEGYSCHRRPRDGIALAKHVNNRPKRKKTLLSHLRAFLGNAVTEADVVGLVEKLCQVGRLSIGDKDAVTYHD